MAGLVPAIPIAKARCFIHRDHRDKPGDDNMERYESLSEPVIGRRFVPIRLRRDDVEKDRAGYFSACLRGDGAEKKSPG